MFGIDCLSVNDSGHLTIGGCDTVELSNIYGTPLYVMDENTIRNSCREYINLMSRFYGDNFRVIYASKAFNCKEICRIMNEEKMALDVVSGGELYTALAAGFPSDRIYFHGNNKTYDELLMAVKNDIGMIVIDSVNEAKIVSEIACQMSKKVNVLVRVKPGVEAHTHSFIKTGQIDSKFGFALENDEAHNVILEISSFENIEFKGLHCHIGSQIIDSEPFVHTANIMMEFIYRLKTQSGIDVSELNLGGGFGVKYLPEDRELDIENCLSMVSKALHENADKLGIKLPKICIEPGRSIVAKSGVTLYKVGNIKDIKNIRKYVSVDGGMTDNPRYMLYASDYKVVNASNASKPEDDIVTIAGKCCESGDVIQENVNIHHINIGEIIAVLCTGAYNYSMSSNYNRIPKPGVVMIKDGQSRVIVRRQKFEDLTYLDI